LPPPTESPATTPASTSQEGDTGLWWLLLLIVVGAGFLVWLLTRPKKKPIDERWRTQATQLATDIDSVSHLLLAGIEPDGAIANDRWAGVLSRSQELRRLADNIAAGAQTVELRNAVTAPAEALRSLELSADAARLQVVGASDAARADGDRVATALTDLREQVSPTAAVHD
jgi:signal transduction histidine kinase